MTAKLNVHFSMKPSSQCVRCNCGNIECRGAISTPHRDLHIHYKTIELLHEAELDFSPLQSYGIILHNQNYIEPVNRGPKVFGLKCTACHQTVYIFTCHSKFAIGFPKSMVWSISDDNDKPSGSSEDLIPQIPSVLRPFIFAATTKTSLSRTCSWDADEIEPIDIDDDFMFSRARCESLVGSYEERPMLSQGSFYFE